MSGLPSHIRRGRESVCLPAIINRVGNWTIVNLLDVEDSAAGRLDGLEVRMARKDLESRDLGVSLFRYAPNLRNPMSHHHGEQEEAYVVVSGSGRVRLDDEIATSVSGTFCAWPPRWCARSRRDRTAWT